MTDSSGRFVSVDVLKGVLIIGIVFVHIVIVRMDVLVSGADASGTGVLSDNSAARKVLDRIMAKKAQNTGC